MNKSGHWPISCASRAMVVAKLGAVQRVDGLGQLHRLPRFVGLQRPNQVQLDLTVGFAEGGPFACRLLHLVFAKDAVALIQNRGDSGVGLHL